MKKIITLLTILLFSATSLSAQYHLEFKGIPINGTTEQFASALKEKGYEIYKNDSEYYYLSGTFSTKEVNIIAVPSPATNTVWKVRVIFPSSDSWFTLKNESNTLKKNLAEKYTKERSYEFFSSPYKEGDGYETTAIFAGKCTWSSFFTCNDPDGIKCGSLMLDIKKMGTKAAIVLDYEDETNSKIFSLEKNAAYTEDL